jgi:hypothetical protein
LFFGEQIHQIYYFTTEEGLVSHLLQVQNLWYTSLPYHNNTKFILVPWRCPKHFPDINTISLCDYFVFPEVFSCEEKRPFYEVAKSLPPSMICELKNAVFATNADLYQLQPNQVKVVEEFHFDQKPSCIGGFLGIDPVGGFDKEATMPWKFRSKYIHLVNHLKHQSGVLSENSNDYVVVHWRRGISSLPMSAVQNGKIEILRRILQ